MRILKNMLDKIKPAFEEGGKLEKLYPVYDGIETFLFVPGHTTKNGVHIRDGIDLKRTMIMVVVALIPALLFGMYNVGHQHFLATGKVLEGAHICNMFWDKFLFGLLKVLPIVVISYGVGLGVEFIFCIIKKHSIQEGFLVSGMLIPLIMPVDVPLWMVAVATIFAVVIGKEVFGGTGMNIVNVALTARAFLFFAYPTKMSGDKVWVTNNGESLIDGFSGATPLANAASTIDLSSKQRLAEEAGKSDLAASLGDQVTTALGKVPEINDSIIGLYAGSIGETSIIAIALGALLLLLTGIASWKIMFSTFAGGYVMSFLFNLWGANPFMEIDALHQLMLGGFAFGAVFMATDPVTASQTNTGKYIYGFLIGVFAIMFRVFNPAYPEGVMLAILFMNIMAPLIDHYVVQSNINKRLKRTSKIQVA